MNELAEQSKLTIAKEPGVYGFTQIRSSINAVKKASLRQIFLLISKYCPLDILCILAYALYRVLYLSIFHAYASKRVKIRGILTTN